MEPPWVEGGGAGAVFDGLGIETALKTGVGPAAAFGDPGLKVVERGAAELDDAVHREVVRIEPAFFGDRDDEAFAGSFGHLVGDVIPGFLAEVAAGASLGGA